MKSSRSLRARFVVGSVLWTIGLLSVAHLISMVFIHHFPQLRRVGFGWMIVIAVGLMGAGLMTVTRGISPLDQLRSKLKSVREGRDRRLEGTYPAEVQPLVSDLNALLDDREQSIARAQAKAGDLAHGLKTPLAVLAQEADRAAKEGHHDLAATLGQQIERMRRQIDYHLAHARAAASGGNHSAQTLVFASVEGLSRTLLRLHADRALAIDVRVLPELSFRGEREDLDEMLGNLLDNACKWARSSVIVDASRDDGVVMITVDDDGPGLEPSMRDRVLQRGVRADEAAPGSGFGLAIVRDLAELYGGSISLDSAPSGGLRARLRLPS